MVTVVPAESNRAVLRYIPELAWGEIPGSGVVRTMRITSSSLSASKETQTSQELRADRMVPSIIEVGASTAGDINFEYSPFSQDDFFQHFLLGQWTSAMNGLLVKGSSVRVTDTDEITLVGKDWTDWIAVGDFVKVEGFLNLVNNGYFEVEAVSFTGGNTVITTVETSLVAEAGSSFTKLLNANDVILKSTTTALAADNTINGGGANAFAGANLIVGQKIYVEGLGKETASVTLLGTPVEGHSFTVTDGVQTVVFEFRTNALLVEPGNVQIVPSADMATLSTRIIAAFNDQFRRQKIRITAATGVAGTKEAGSFEFATTAEVGDQVTVNDGISGVITFTFAAVASGLTTVAHGASAADSATNLAAAINAHPSLNVTATPTTDTVDIVNDNYTGGELTEVVDGGTDITTTDFTGGAAPTLVIKNHRLTGAVVTESIPSISVGAFSGGDATKGGFFTIAALPDDDTIVTEETLGVDANGGGLTVVIKGSHLRNPGDPEEIEKQSFSAETRFTDVNKSFQHSGLRTGTVSLSVTSGEIVGGSISFMGRETTRSNDSVLGDETDYTVLDTTATEILNATANVGQVTKDGEALSTAVTAIEINGEANLREQRAVGEKFPAGIGYGRFSMNGTITAYFKDFAFFTDFIEHNTLALAFDFECLDHNKVFWRIPAIKITADPISPEGIDTDVMEPMEWSAQRDPVFETMLMLDRFSSVYPAAVA